MVVRFIQATDNEEGCPLLIFIFLCTHTYIHLIFFIGFSFRLRSVSYFHLCTHKTSAFSSKRMKRSNKRNNNNNKRLQQWHVQIAKLKVVIFTPDEFHYNFNTRDNFEHTSWKSARLLLFYHRFRSWIDSKRLSTLITQIIFCVYNFNLIIVLESVYNLAQSKRTSTNSFTALTSFPR